MKNTVKNKLLLFLFITLNSIFSQTYLINLGSAKLNDYNEFQNDYANTSALNSSIDGGRLNLLWKSENNTINVETYSAPKSSPVIVDGIIYIGDDSGEVHAIHLNNGACW